MKYIALIFVLPFWYSFSFARFNWKEKNRLAAAGVMIMLLAAIVLFIYMFFIRRI